MSLKEQICSGTVVKFRDERLAVAISSINPEEAPTYMFYGLSALTPNKISRYGILTLNTYDDNLDNPLSMYDIMAISYDTFSFKGIMGIMFGFVSEEDIHWDWKREEIKEVTMAEVEKKFGCKVKIVKEEN